MTDELEEQKEQEELDELGELEELDELRRLEQQNRELLYKKKQDAKLDQELIDPELVDPELAKSKKEKKEKLNKLITLKEIKKLDEEIKKLESGDSDSDSSHQPVLTPNERTYVNFPVSLLEKFVEKEVFYELPSYVQEMIVNKIEKDKEDKILIKEEQERLKIEEKDRLIQEEHNRKLKEDQDRKLKEEQIRKDYNPCPYCNQRTVNKKILINNEQAQCENPSCGKIIYYCRRCKGIVDDMHLDPEDLDYLTAFEDKYAQGKLEREQQKQQNQQEEISRQQIMEQVKSHPIQYGPPVVPTLTETLLDTRFAQAALSRAPETIESMKNAIGEKRTEQLITGIVGKVIIKKE